MKKFGLLAVALVLCALAAQPALAQAGCCELPDNRVTTTRHLATSASLDGTIIWIPGPIFPIPIPIPKGCYRTDNEAGCKKLGGSFYQLGVCSGGKCHPTAARVEPNSLFDPPKSEINFCPDLTAPATDETVVSS